MENKDVKRILEILAYSGRPYNVPANTIFNAEPFDSIEILEEGTKITKLYDSEGGKDVLILANWTDYEWPVGSVLTWDCQFAAIQASKIVKINRTKKN